MATNQNALYAYRYLQEKYKLKPYQAAGVVGNLIQESSMNTGARNRGDGRDGSDSIGIAQWNGDRAKALHRFAGDNVHDLDTQLDFMMDEMQNGPERSAYDSLMAAKDVHGATAAMIGYERPQGWSADNPTGGHGWDNRLRHAGSLVGLSPDAIAQAQPVTADVQMAKAQTQSPGLLATDPPKPEAAKVETAEADKKPLIDLPKILPDEIFGTKTGNVAKLLGGLGEIAGKPTEDLNKQMQAIAARSGRRDNSPVVLTADAQGQQRPQGSLPPHPANLKPWDLLQLMMKQRGGRLA